MARKPSAVRHFLISVSGVEGLFATKSGGDPSVGVNKVYDGGSPTPEVLTEPIDFDDLTVSRPYRLDRDAPIAARLRPLVGRRQYTVTVQPTDEDYVRQGRPTRYTGILTRVKEPDVDAGASTEARFELTFSISTAV